MSVDPWDNPEYKTNSDYVKFETVGDRVVGTIVTIRRTEFDDGKVAPSIILNVGGDEEKTVTASQYQLKEKLVELRPKVGEVLYIEFVGVEKLSGGRTLKNFDVKVGAAATAASGYVPGRVDAAPAAAGGYTAEQLAAFKSLGMEPPPLDTPPF